MARPRLSQNVLARPLDTEVSYKPVAVPRPHALSQTKNSRPFILSAHNSAYTQPPNLPRLPGQVGFLGDPLPKPPRGKTLRHPVVDIDPISQDYDVQPFLHPESSSEQSKSKNANKKLQQWKRWQEITLPTLILPYLRLLAESESLSRLPSFVFPQCTCGHARKITPIAVSFTVLQSLSLQSCPCLPSVAIQLITQGFFPCAPLLPSLVIDVRLLDFASRVFMHMPPNNTAWCKAMEDFLASLGYGLRREDNLRRRFENALRWFSTLKNITSHHISIRLDRVRSVVATSNATTSSSQSPSTPRDATMPQTSRTPPSKTAETHILLSQHGESPPLKSRLPRPSRQAKETPSSQTPRFNLQPHVTAAAPPSRIPRRRSGIEGDSHPPVTAVTPPSRLLERGSGTGDINLVFTQTPASMHTPSQSTTHTSVLPRQENLTREIPISNAPNVAEFTSNGSGDTTQPPLPALTSGSRKRRRSKSPTSEPSSNTPFPPPEPRTRPSEYLRKRCPLCFGGEYPPKTTLKPDAIVCIDACFTQKRNKGPRDPERTHPETLFISESDLQRMQAHVESIRPPKDGAPNTKRRRNAPIVTQVDETEDMFEEGLSVPVSVLQGCEASFKAADESREKASTQYFDDTALMAMLCRHDRVLWIANMRSAGEKQHYALILLETLFQHLPLAFVIGLLYDIGCQLHRSCLKWGFLKPYIDRIIFGISVFHAFGHQWPCQLVYHPRKCIGFGLSDGEGCERFWHSISKLIPMLRVSGYYQRLYTLDVQVHHFDSSSLKRLGGWLSRRTQHCKQKRIAAEEGLLKCGIDEKELRDEWAAQVHAQTRPSPRRSKDQGKTAVEEVIRLRKAYEVQKKRTSELEQQLTNLGTDGYLHALASIDIGEARQSLKRIEGQLRTKETSLGVHQKAELSRLVNDPYIALRMNALALKFRLRDKLRARKFELNPVERMARKFSHNTRKLHSQMDSSVQRRDPTIQQVARGYNKLCDEMAKLVTQKKAPPGSTPPSKIPMEGLFNLDIDDVIWQDAGLTDDRPDSIPQTQHEVGETETAFPLPPRWLSNEDIQKGIRAMLELDRCCEEEARLLHERRAMQIWFNEEWKVLNDSINNIGNDDILHALEQRKKDLCLLQVLWSDRAEHLPSGQGTLPQLPEWGPTTSEIVEARSKYYMASIQHEVEKLDPQHKYDSETEEEADESELDDEDVDGFLSVMDFVSAVYPTGDDV